MSPLFERRPSGSTSVDRPDLLDKINMQLLNAYGNGNVDMNTKETKTKRRPDPDPEQSVEVLVWHTHTFIQRPTGRIKSKVTVD